MLVAILCVIAASSFFITRRMWAIDGANDTSELVELSSPTIAGVQGCGISVDVEEGSQLQMAYGDEEFANVTLNRLGNLDNLAGGKLVRVRCLLHGTYSPEASLTLLPVMNVPVVDTGKVKWSRPVDLCGLKVVGYVVNVDGSHEMSLSADTMSIDSPVGRSIKVRAELAGNLSSKFSPELLLESSGIAVVQLQDNLLESSSTSSPISVAYSYSTVALVASSTTGYPTTSTSVTSSTTSTSATTASATTTTSTQPAIISTQSPRSTAPLSVTVTVPKSVRSVALVECVPPYAVVDYTWSDGARLSLPVLACADPQWKLRATYGSSSKRCQSQTFCEISGLNADVSYSITFSYVTGATSQSGDSSPINVVTRKAEGRCNTVSDGKWFVDGPNYEAKSFSAALDKLGRSFALHEGLLKWTGSRKSHSKTLSKRCNECFVITADCIAQSCLFECAFSSSDPDCKVCVRKSCDSVLMNCSGFSDKKMLPPELV